MKITDGKKTVEIAIKRWEGSQYGEDMSRDYFCIDEKCYDRETDIYTVANVDYCVEMANSTGEEGARSKYDVGTDSYVEDENVEIFVEELFLK